MRYQISHKNEHGHEVADDSESYEGTVEDANATLREYLTGVDVFPGDTLRIVEF